MQVMYPIPICTNAGTYIPAACAVSFYQLVQIMLCIYTPVKCMCGGGIVVYTVCMQSFVRRYFCECPLGEDFAISQSPSLA